MRLDDLHVTPVSPGLGVEVDGFDIRHIDDPGPSAADVERLVVDKQVVVFRNQELTPPDLIRFTALLGEPDIHVREEFLHPSHREILVISNIVENGRPIGSREEGFNWHTDLSYMERPSSYTILYALRVPDVDGDTLFASMKPPYDVLPEEQKAGLRGRRIHHSYETMWKSRPHKKEMSQSQRQRTPPVSHPIVRTHPVTGKDSIYINFGTCTGVDGYSKDEALALVGGLQRAALAEERIYRHRWRAGDLVIWDNRSLFHRATPYDMDKDQRLIYRTTVRGEKPYLAQP